MSSSQYKSAIRAQPPQEQHSNSKYSEQARQLQEFFPLWKNDGPFFSSFFHNFIANSFILSDLQSLLVEVSGDIELAAARISDGTSFPSSLYTVTPLKKTLLARHGRAMG